MKVKCTKIINPITGNLAKKDPWLTIGKSYIVLSISINKDNQTLFRLIGDEPQIPALFDSKQFEIESGKIPPNWIVKIDQNNRFQLAPSIWLRDGFWEEFFDGIEHTKKEFQEEMNIILKSL